MKTQMLSLPHVVPAPARFAEIADVGQDVGGATSHDGIAGAYPHVMEEQFAAMDGNRDGAICRAEMTAAVEAGEPVMPE